VLDTSTPSGRAKFQMMGVFAQFERAIRERGLARARQEGIHLGRKFTEDSGQCWPCGRKAPVSAKSPARWGSASSINSRLRRPIAPSRLGVVVLLAAGQRYRVYCYWRPAFRQSFPLSKLRLH
jgi:hypothetical protein